MSKKQNNLKISHNLEYYRKIWRDHQNGTKKITDPKYLKELQDIILYPDRHGFKV